MRMHTEPCPVDTVAGAGTKMVRAKPRVGFKEPAVGIAHTLKLKVKLVRCKLSQTKKDVVVSLVR